MDDFRSAIDTCGLLDLGYVGERFTWWNKQCEPNDIFERLDRALVSPNWVDMYPSLMVHHLARESSYHIAIKTSPIDFGETPPEIVMLNRCTTALTKWSQEEFGDINRRLSEARKRLAFIDGCRPIEEIVAERRNICSEIHKLIITQEETYWRQRSRSDFLKEGDRNTKFFHLKASGHRRRNKTTKLVDDNGV
ncbi:hypothetical protein RND81_14G199600 [Saponaria officinalis]|uniref:Uncharacterized protein n=1 Tax=Saponaria officinalis TaxID=3572 RepID=A0AAW1GVU1_SAPOF